MRLDASCIVSALAFIPIIAVISQRAQDNPWAVRPIDGSCPKSSVCWQADGCSNPACECECGDGLFAGWIPSTLGVIILALVINTGYGWLVGKLVQAFSTIDRAIADAFSLLLVYFIGDPLMNGTSLGNMCLNLVAFIVPLSTSIFAVASSEMQRVIQAADLIEGKTTGETEVTDSEETPSDTGDSSSSPPEETSEDEEAALSPHWVPGEKATRL